MTSAPEAADIFVTLNETVQRLQKSTRRTLPVFLIGIAATIAAAGIAVYYIVTLSNDLAAARVQLQQSNAALKMTQSKLARLQDLLRETQQHVTSAGAAATIANAISDLASSQRTLTAASTSIDAAATKISPTPPPIGTCRLIANNVTYMNGQCEITIMRGGSFRMSAVGQQGPSASVSRQGAFATGSWQAGPGAPVAQLGPLRRNGACWFNENGQICAWK